MRTLLHLATVFTLVICTACSQEPSSTKSEPHTVQARTIRLTQTEAQECRSLPGQVEAKNSVTLSSKLSGTVIEVLAVEGTLVRKGQPIMRIDDAELRQREQSIRSTTGQANLERQALAARSAQAKATSERMQKLLAMHAVSQDDAEKAKAEYEALASQTRAIAAQSAASGFQGEELKSLMAYSTVTAPISGVLTRRTADLGSFVNAGEPLATIDDAGDGFEIVSQADESLLGIIRKDMPVVAMIPTLAPEPFLTTLSAVIAQVDPANRAFRVKAAVNGTKSISAGLFGKICVPVAKGQKLLVPLAAIRPRGELATALIVDTAGILRLRLLKLGARYQKAVLGGQTFILENRSDLPAGDEEMIEILSGLHAGEEVVIGAPDTAREGDKLIRS